MNPISCIPSDSSVYPNFQSLGLAVASVFEYANLLRGEQAYQFLIVSEQGGPVTTSQGSR